MAGLSICRDERDLRSHAPQTCALTGLSYIPNVGEWVGKSKKSFLFVVVWG